jgi:anti-sigma factor RsiW
MDDYVDGLLDDGLQEEVRRHLAICPACAEKERGLRRLVADARALPRAMAPPRDLWPSLARRLGATPGKRRWMERAWDWGGLAAAASLVVIGALAAWWSSRQPAPFTPDGTLGAAVRASYAGLAADDEYERADAAFLAVLETRRGRLRPASRARVDASLRAIDEALDAIRAELRERPSDPGLNLMLASVHQRKVDVLRTVVSLTS